MQTNDSAGRITLGLLPQPEGRAVSFLTSWIVNLAVLATVLIVSMTAKHVIQQHYEMTELIVPDRPLPQKVKPPEPPKLPPPPEQPKIQMQAPKIDLPKPKPEPKPIEMVAKVTLPVVKAKPQTVIMIPQPKPALRAAMPAQSPQVRPSTAPVHLGETFGVTPNPNATRPATVAAIGNPYGGMQGPAVAPHGVVGSTGIGNGTKFGSNASVVGRVASAGIPGATGTGTRENYGRVASAGIPAATQVTVAPVVRVEPASTDLEVLSKPPVQYTEEARQLRIQGDVVVRVTFLASGHVEVLGVVRGLGHGLDQEALRVAKEIRFRPATRNGHPVDLTTTVTITFQLA